MIISPIEGSPAARAGIEPGDVIKRVDGVEISTLEFDEAVARMQGPGGSEVTLVVERRGRELTFRIRRAKYEVKAVEGELLEDGVALRQAARVRRGRRPTLEKLLDQLSRARRRKGGIKGLVLDMRRNPGGLLDQGIRVADLFIADGLIVKTVGKGGHVMDEAKAHSRGTWSGFPMIVVVDGATASAAEIVAGALQDHGRAVVLGTQTFGKGSVQTVIDLDGCGGKPCGLKLTVARYYTPKGRSIQGQGITPNVVVDATAPPGRSDGRRPAARARSTQAAQERAGREGAGRQAPRRLPAADGARLPALVVAVFAAERRRSSVTRARAGC